MENRRFWVPKPSVAVLEDFKRIFNAQPVNLPMFILGMQPDYKVMLAKPIKNYEETWGDLKFLGKWKFTPHSINITEGKKSSISQFIEQDCCCYNLELTTMAAQILGGRTYLYNWRHGQFKPLVLLSEDQNRCGAIAIASNMPQEDSLRLKLTEYALKIPLNLVSLTLEHTKHLKDYLNLPTTTSSCTRAIEFESSKCKGIESSQFNEANLVMGLPKYRVRDRRSPIIDRICGRTACSKKFQCGLECEDDYRKNNRNACYCPECINSATTDHPLEKSYCESRFGEPFRPRRTPELTSEQCMILREYLEFVLCKRLSVAF